MEISPPIFFFLEQFYCVTVTSPLSSFALLANQAVGIAVLR